LAKNNDAGLFKTSGNVTSDRIDADEKLAMFDQVDKFLEGDFIA